MCKMTELDTDEFMALWESIPFGSKGTLMNLRSGIPLPGTPERWAWEIVIDWAQKNHDEARLRLGSVISDHYPHLINAIATAKKELDDGSASRI